jgi:outer membrane murein-binding lipoprotein Lpp
MTFRWLVAVAAWLDARFPPKVTVTDEVFAALQEKEHRHSKEIAKLSGDVMVMKSEIAAAEKSLAALKDFISKEIAKLSGDVMVMKSEIAAAEKSLAALKDFISKGGAGGVGNMNRRAQFIAEGRMADPAAAGGA